MKRLNLLAIALTALASGASSLSRPTHAATMTLATIADVEVGERPNDDRGSGTGTSVNVRTITTGAADRNEIIGLKFDLTGINFANVTAASVRMIWHRDSNAQNRPWVMYGVNDGAMGGDNNGMTPGYDDNTWVENSVRMSTMPGLIYDGVVPTQGVNGATTTNLGGGNFPGAVTKNSSYTFSPASLLTFLSSHPDDLVTLLIAAPSDSTATGQDRFASKEATSLDGGSPTGPVGSFAPVLELTVVPEPASTALLAATGIALFAAGRRRAS
jgi:hypothetical protein